MHLGVMLLQEFPKDLFLDHFFFLIYIIDLPDGFHSNPKLFADDTSLFLTVHDITETTNELNNDLRKINIWAIQWKMSFNPDIFKQAHEECFQEKTSK